LKYSETDDTYNRYQDILCKGNSFGLILGIKCNSNCIHCFEKTDFDINKSLSNEIIDKIFELIDNSKKEFVIDIIGGETLLYKDLCKKICIESNKRNILTELSTNGSINDENTISFLREIKPTFINVSVDRYHQEFISIEEVQKFVNLIYNDFPISINYCYDSFNIKKSKNEWFKEIQKNLLPYFNDLELYLYMDEIFALGNAEINKIGIPLSILQKSCEINCFSHGFYVDYNGNLSKKCFLHHSIKEECKFGSIFNIKSLEDLQISEIQKMPPDIKYRKLKELN
jgi:organic radical activating enzyme